MKFNLRNISYVAIMAITPFVSGCSSDDDDDNNGGNNSDTVVTSATYTLGLSYTEDHLALFDMTVEYTTPSGENVTEPITEAWSKTVEFTSFPSSFSLIVTQTLKPGVDLTAKESYGMGASVTKASRAYNAEGQMLQDHTLGTLNTYHVIVADKIEQYADDHAEEFKLSFTITLNADKSDIVITND